MIKLFRRVGRYITALLTGRFNELADPKVQLEQAITEAQDQHRLLTEQAANVLANQKDIEMQLSRKVGELEDADKKARQAVLMADKEQQGGNIAKAGELNRAAESFTQRLVSLESEVESLKTLHVQAAKASDQAKAAVRQNSTALQKKLSDRQRLLSQLDQTKMQEQMNKAMATLSATVGDDVPTFDEVQRKIEQRNAKALGKAELQGETIESAMLEVEQAARDSETTSRLEKIRAELGVTSASGELTGGSQTGGSQASTDETK